MLNDKQEKFAQSYVLHNNATEAAKSAGYAAASAANQGYRLLQIDEIVERIRILSKCDFADNLFLEDDGENEEPESLIEDDNEDSLDPTYPEEVETSV